MSMSIEDIKKYDGTWVGSPWARYKVGDIGFLIQVAPDGGRKRVELRSHPVATAAPYFEPILFGVVDGGRSAVTALGCAMITEVQPINERGKVLTLWDEDLKHALETLTYPELFAEYDDLR